MSNSTDKQFESIAKIMEEASITKESYVVQGTTPDFIWYESEILQRDISWWESRFKQLVSVMEARHKDNQKMIEDLLRENKNLKAQLKEKQ